MSIRLGPGVSSQALASAVALLQPIATAATDAELSAAIASLQAAAATDAELADAVATINAALTGKQAASTAATDAELAAAVAALPASYDLRGPAPSGDATGATDTAAIQALLDAASAAGGGHVPLRVGTYWTTGLVIPAKVVLAGKGRGTVLKAAAGLNGSIISLTAACYGFGIRDLAIDGNYANVVASNGIYLDTNAGVQSTSASLYGGVAPDPVPSLQNVFVQQCKGTGIYVGVNMREMKAWNVYVLYADIGWDVLSHDANFIACTSGGTRWEGFRDKGRNNRYTACKSFYAGQNPVDGTEVIGRGHGWYITNEATQLTGCESQENSGAGVYLDGTVDLLTEVLITGHLFGGDKDTALYIKGSVGRCIVSGVITAASRYTTGHGVTFDGTLAGYENVITLHAAGGIDYSTHHPIRLLNAAELRGSTVRLNTTDAMLSVPYAANYTPNPSGAETVAMTLTGNLTIANTDVRYTAPGQRLRFVLTQDATGTRTVAFGTQYKTSWAPSLLGGRTNVIEFVNVGTAAVPLWVQVAATVGLV